MGGFGNRRAEKCAQTQSESIALVSPPPTCEVSTFGTDPSSLKLPILSPVSPEKPFETSPLKGMTLTHTAPNSDSTKFHGNTMVVTLPVDAQPSVLYHGRTKSYFSAGTGEAEVSRNNKGLTFDPGDIAVADGCTEIRRTLVQTKDGPAYQYQISFKKMIPGDEHQTGALDPGKIAIRVHGKEYDLTPQTKTPAPTLPMMPLPSTPGVVPAPDPSPTPSGPKMVIPAPPGTPSSPTPAPAPHSKERELDFPSPPKKDGPKEKLPGSDAFPDVIPKGGPKMDPNFPKIPPGGPAPKAKVQYTD